MQVIWDASQIAALIAHIKRALAAMADMGFLEADHQRAEFRQAQPLRHLAAQHAALGFGAADLALAGDDEHEGQAVAVRALQERQQRAVGAGLRHAVQIEPGIDFFAAARKLRALAASDRRQRRRLPAWAAQLIRGGASGFGDATGFAARRRFQPPAKRPAASRREASFAAA